MGRSYFRFYLSIALSFSIVFSSFPFQRLAQAQSSGGGSHPSQQESATDTYDESIEELKASFLTQSKTRSHLDPFLLTRQIVIDERPEQVAAVVKEEKRQDYADRLDYLNEQLEQLNELTEQVQEKIRVESAGEANPDRLTQLDLILADINSRSAILDIELQDLREHSPDSESPLDVDSFIDQDLKVRRYFGRNLNIILENRGGKSQFIEQKKFTQSLSPNFNAENPLSDASGWIADETKMMIADDRGEVMHKFLDSVEGVLFFGEYLVYLEKNVSLADGVLPVRFIDLRYFRTNIGNGPLPVFTLPLKVSQKPENFSIEGGKLSIGSQKLSYQQLNMLAKVQQIIFNVNVALVDPDAYENVKPLISEIAEFMAKSLQGQSQLFQTQLQEAVDTEGLLSQTMGTLEARKRIVGADARILADKILADGKITDAEYADIKVALDSSEKMAVANHSLAAGRGLMTRIRLFSRFLVQPRPEGAPKLFNALVILATGNSEQRSQVKSLIKGSPLHKFAKYGAATGGLILASNQLPEPYRINLYKSFDLISAMAQHFHGYLVNIDYGAGYAELSRDAFVTSTTGWTYFIDSYFADGKWPKFLLGLSQVLLVPLKMFASLHLAVNSYKMLKATFKVRSLSKQTNQETIEAYEAAGENADEELKDAATRAKLGSDLGFLEAFKEAARLDQMNYWQSLADAEQELLNEKAASKVVQEMTAEEAAVSEKAKAEELAVKEQLVSELVERLKSGRADLKMLERDIAAGQIRQRSSLGKYLKSLIGFVKLNRFGKKVESDFAKEAAKAEVASVPKFRVALQEAFLSYSSLRSTFKFSALTWGYFFMSRSFFFSPSKWMMALIYPNYFGRTVSVREGKQHFPSKYNGGLTVLPAALHRTLSAALVATPISKVKGFNQLFISKEGLENLRAFEKQVIPLEAVAIEVAKKRAQKALVQSINDPERLLAIFSSHDSLAGVSTGIRNLSDPKIKNLKRHDQVFYRAYFTRTYDLYMQEALSEIASLEKGKTMDPNEFAKRFMSEVRSNNIEAGEIDKADIQEIESQLEKSDKFSGIKDWAEKVASDGVKFFTRLNVQFRHKLLQTIDPNNYQVERFLVAKKKVEDPRAMERAMRMEVSNMVSSIPIGILSTLALYAGVQSGIVVPFDPTGLNSDTHYIYMSRYLFYAGFVPGIVMGMLANTWMKLQEDSRIDAIGGFDKLIQQQDGRKGFWRYYVKNVFKHPKNKWQQNQLFVLKLIAANIPAAAVTFLLTSTYGLGRLDMGTFLGSYIILFTTALVGFDMKMDQAFELSSKWVYNKIPRQLRAFPEAQKYMGAQLQKRKILYSYFENLFGIIVTENIVGDMLTLKDHPRYGTRAFSRLIFGGETPTTIIVGFADKMIEAFGKIPGVETVFEGVKYVFSNGYEAFERFPEELTQLDPSVDQVQPPADLPKGLVPEVTGKAAGLLATVGAFAAAPYAINAALQLRREKKIQKQGKALSCKRVFQEK